MRSLFYSASIVICIMMLISLGYAQSRSFSTDYIGHNVYWNGTNWVSTGAGYGSVIGPGTGTGDINFYTTGNAASGGLTRTLTQAAAITPAGTVSSTAVQAYTGSFGNVNATGTISASALHVTDLNVTNLTVNGGSYSTGGTSATIVAGWPDAIVCYNGNTRYINHLSVAPYTGTQYLYDSLSGGTRITFDSSGNYVGNISLTGFNCINKSIAQLYASGQAFNFVGNGGANGENGYDNIISGTTKITANSTGYISLTTAGTTTGYFNTTGKLIVPGVSTTGPVSATEGYMGQLGVGRPVESWMASNTVVAKGMMIADGGFFASSGQGLSWDDAHVSINSNDGTDFEVRTNYTGRIKVDAAGNVGVNTMEPNATLDVHGTISATTLTVNGVAVTGGGGGSSTPAGAVMYFAMQTCPTGWVAADGSLISRATYADLYTALGTTYGVGDGSTTFGVPDLRGSFIRGWDNGKGYDSGRTFGSYQADELKSHTHLITSGASGGGASSVANGSSTGSSQSTRYTGGTETRPKNVAMQPCIKY